MEDNTHGWAPAPSRLLASPLARKIARERGLDLGAIAGSGPGGRIIERDLGGAGAGRGRQHPSAVRAVPQRSHTALPAGAATKTGAASHSDETEDPLPGAAAADGCAAIALDQNVSLVRLGLLQEILGESHGAVPLWAFLARALLRLGHGPLAVAEGCGAPRWLEASATDPVTALAVRLGDPAEASLVLVDLACDPADGDALPLPRSMDMQVVIGAPSSGASGRAARISVMARAESFEAAGISALLAALAASVESPGALLSHLPDI